MAFLAYIINMDGVVMDDAKEQAVINWPIPSNIKEPNCTGNFSSLTAPLISLLKDGKKNNLSQA